MRCSGLPWVALLVIACGTPEEPSTPTPEPDPLRYRYDLASDRRVQRTKSVATQALAARGLLAAHRVLSPAASEGPLLEAAHKTLIWLDDDRWNPKVQLYADEKLGKEVELTGVASTLGLLREMAIEFKDGHYLLRYKQLLEGAQQAGLFTAPGDHTPAGLAAQLALP